MKRRQSGLLSLSVFMVGFFALFWVVAAPAGNIKVEGEIISTVGGFRFPDGSLQQKASSAPFVIVPDDTTDIGTAVAGLTSGGTVFVRALDACYLLNDVIHVDRSD